MIPIYCIHSSIVPCFPFVWLEKVLEGWRHNPQGGAPVPRWTEPDVEDEDRGERSGVFYLRGGGVVLFYF